MSQHFTKVNGSFERQLSPEMMEQYFATQSNLANPLSPLEYQAQQQTQQGNTQTPTTSNQMSQTPQTPQAPDYADTFNSVMLDILKQAQGVDTTELLKRKRALERTSLNRASETTPEELRTLSPNQQNTIRSGNVKALSSEIDENAYLLQKAESQIDNFYRAFEATSKLGAEFSKNMPLPEKVKESFVTALQQRPTDDWATILGGLNDKQKTEVLSSVDYSKLTEKPTQAKELSASDIEKQRETAKVQSTQAFDLRSGIKNADTVLKDLNLGEEGELAGVFGRFQQFIPEKIMSGDRAYLYNKLVQLRQSIVLALRAKLKGQGTITDQETAMLEKASTAISRNLDIEDVKTEVEQMKTFLEFQLSQTGDSGGDNDPLGIL